MNTKRKELRPCQQSACRIQTCLKNNSFDDSKCITEILDFYDCCQRMNKRIARGAAAASEAVDPQKASDVDINISQCPDLEKIEIKRRLLMDQQK